MAQAQSKTRAASAARNWEGQNIPDYLSKSAALLPAISATEAGTPGRSISFTATKHANPINLGGGIPDPESLPSAGLQASFDNVFTNTPEAALR